MVRAEDCHAAHVDREIVQHMLTERHVHAAHVLRSAAQ